MKADFSRLTFRQDKHYSSVRMQQGRIQLDADWNEQIDIQAHHDRTAARDAVGPRGAPLDDAGFGLSGGAGALQIGAGRYYVDGILCENEADVGFIAQPDLPRATLPAQAGNYLAYLDVWQRLVTAVEDPAIREVALGGPDTATRTQTVWQVKLQMLNGADDCAEFEEDWEPAGMASTGKLRAQARPQEERSDDPCIVPPGAGYTRLENQLYRVEIHDGGEPYGAARSPGTETVIETVESPDKVRVAADDGQTWRVGQWVELFKQDSTTPGTLIRITGVEAQKLTLDIDNVEDRDLASIVPAPDRLRRVATFKFSRNNGAILARLEGITGDFVTVSDPGKDPTLGFAGGNRVELSDEERTLRDEPGVMVELKNVIGNDLEIVWPSAPMTMVDFPTRSGGTPPTARRWDSEGAIPLSTETQWQELEDGVQVGFDGGTYRSGDYWLIPARSLGGRVEWPLDADTPRYELPHGIEHHYCPLALLERANDVWTPKRDCRRLFPPLTRLPANKIEYTPGGPCKALEEVTTVQEAIDELCKTGPGAQGIRILDVRTVDPEATLPNGNTVPVSALAGGLRVECDTPVDPQAVAGLRPTCLVMLEMPFPFKKEERTFWEIDKVVGYWPLVLRGNVTVEDKIIRWAPAQEMEEWLRATLFERMAEEEQDNTILVHLTLKGNFIWAEGDPAQFLDGEAVSVPTAQNPVGLELPSGDGRRGGDFEMWFWIRSELTSVRSVDFEPPASVTGGRVKMGKVRLHGEVTEAVDVRLSSSDPEAVFENGQSETTVTVQAGKSDADFQITTSPVLVSKDVSISAFSEEDPDTVKTATLRVLQPALVNVDPEPDQVSPGGSSTLTVSLDGRAPEGMELDLEGDPPDLVRLPSTKKVEAGKSSAEFQVSVSADALPGQRIAIRVSYETDESTDSIGTELEVIR